MSKVFKTTQKDIITTPIRVLVVQGFTDVDNQSVESLGVAAPLIPGHPRFVISREAVIELHKVLGKWIEQGNSSLGTNYYLAC